MARYHSDGGAFAGLTSVRVPYLWLSALGPASSGQADERAAAMREKTQVFHTAGPFLLPYERIGAGNGSRRKANSSPPCR